VRDRPINFKVPSQLTVWELERKKRESCCFSRAESRWHIQTVDIQKEHAPWSSVQGATLSRANHPSFSITGSVATKKRTCSWNGRNIMGESENPKIMPSISNKCRTSHHVGTLFRCYFLVDACRLEAWPFVMPGCSSFVADALSALSLWCRTNVLFPEHILFVKNTTRS
jgi:hypothetical protein